MVDGSVAAAETLASPAIEQNVRINPVESQPVNKEAAQAAEMIDEGLNSGAKPEDLIRKLLEIPSGNEGDGKEDISKQKEDSNQRPEERFKTQLEAHLQKFGLQAQNLESDQRYQQICKELIRDWELQNPEPYKGKQQLTDKEKDEWRNWITRKTQYGDIIANQARERFEQQYKEDFAKYQRYGVYESLDDDPRFKAIYEQKIRIVGKGKWSYSSSPEQIAYVHARSEFIQYYPEVAKVYAAKDKEIDRILELKKQREEQKKDPSKSTTESISENKESKTQKETNLAEQKTVEERTENLREENLREEIENLREENDELRAILGIKRREISGMIQKARGKKNVIYDLPDGSQIFVKYAERRKNQRDDVEGLGRERDLLETLANTGVVPRVIDFKLYPNGKKARLIMESLGGLSLDYLNENNKSEYPPLELILATARAHNEILKRNVVISDVNKGTYLLKKDSDGKVQSYIVDFELGCSLDKKSDEDRDRILSWFRKKDLGLDIFKGEINDNVFKKMDIHLWARTMVEHLLGPSYLWEDIPVPSESEKEYEYYRKTLEPLLEEKIREDARKNYEAFKDVSDVSEEQYIAREIQTRIPQELRSCLISYTLKERLEQRGINLTPNIISFLQKALHPDINQRPASFDDLFLST